MALSGSLKDTLCSDGRCSPRSVTSRAHVANAPTLRPAHSAYIIRTASEHELDAPHLRFLLLIMLYRFFFCQQLNVLLSFHTLSDAVALVPLTSSPRFVQCSAQSEAVSPFLPTASGGDDDTDRSVRRISYIKATGGDGVFPSPVGKADR